MSRIVILFSFLVFLGTAHASVDLGPLDERRTIRGDEVTISATVDAIPVALIATMNSRGISSITFEIDGRKIIIPNAEFSDLTEPQIQSVQILYGYRRRVTPDNQPAKASIFFQLDFGPAQFNGGKMEYRKASFHFSNREYVYRRTRELVGPDKWQHYKKRIGLPNELAGTERVLR